MYFHRDVTIIQLGSMFILLQSSSGLLVPISMNSAYIWMAISALAPVIRQVCDFSSIPSVDQINGIEGAVLSPPSEDTIMIFLFICDNNMDSHAYKVSLTRHIHHTCLLHRTHEVVMDSSGPGAPLYFAERACVRLCNPRPSLVCGICRKHPCFSYHVPS
ncbi:hypothetical protein BJ912DRAFT_680644 [Pholiota molesta]|nr:hypothetical protein BJ912DRAFT_680644 [Pholiota molesta]